MRTESCLIAGLLFLFSLTVGAGAAPTVWSGNGHTYDAIYVPGGISWTAADNAAEAMPGDWHLATVTSAEENQFIYDLIKDNPQLWCSGGCGPSLGPWLGGHATTTWPDYDWTWVTGESFNYKNWALNKPFGSGDAIAYYGGQSHWTNWLDIDWYPLCGYIIERPTCPVPAPSAIVMGSIGLAFIGWFRRRRTL